MRLDYFTLLLLFAIQAQSSLLQQPFQGTTRPTSMTLKTIYHHSSPNGPIPRLFRRLDISNTILQQQQQVNPLSSQYIVSPIPSQYERLGKQAKNYLIQQASIVHSLNHQQQYQPRKIRWKHLAELTVFNTDILKEPVEDYIPDVTSRDTVLALALMTSNAYIETDNTTDWYDLGVPWKLNKSFGWQEDGIRGHIFGNADNTLFIISFKGTSVGLLKEPTGDKDKINDNMLFSCCCARISRAWTPVCDCFQDNDYICKMDCLENSILKTEFYYDHAMEIYLNVAEQYPNATIWLAGHSLGGALASLVGQTFGIPAVSFEAPGDQLASIRLHLPRYNNMPLWHFGHTADPLYVRECIGPASSCWYAGFAMESKCHTGKMCVWDTVQDLGWRVDARTHRIKYVIDEILNRADGPPLAIPQCKKERGCSDCQEWAYPDKRD
ncbi:Alpha/Beta hydrolase protein [Chlamydoabsidia padenii]|nr:Alpha/Beta hydrolase protein [Chlamydoabsidia padenii]